ncbi:MAG TPA: hypothetical protein VFB62_20500 [Polyangiaceae bacterium]|jgi:hypothetical protein|nr:hypothetical protein [Polyangiaceae bacterium]
MSKNDIGQYMLMVVGGGMGVMLLWALFIKAPQARKMRLQFFAQQRGLSFTPPVSLGFHTTGLEVTVLQGAWHGVPFVLRSSEFVNARRGSVARRRSNTEIACRALAPVAATFSVMCERGLSGPQAGAVFTGDTAFDPFVKTRSDNPAAAHAWLTMPELRAALRATVGDAGAVELRYAGGEITIRVSQDIYTEAQLDRALALTAASAHARLG